MITEGFIKAAGHRARALGMPEHPVVVIAHPIASKNPEQILALARDSVKQIASHLMSAMQGANHE